MQVDEVGFGKLESERLLCLDLNKADNFGT